MAKRRTETDLNRDNVGDFLEDEVGCSRPSGASFERADSAILESRRMLRASEVFSPPAPAEGSSSSFNPFANIRLTSSPSAPSSSNTGGFTFGVVAPPVATGDRASQVREALAKLHREHRERILQLVNSEDPEECAGSWTGMMLQFLERSRRLKAELNALEGNFPAARPLPANPPPAATSGGSGFGSFAPPPLPPPAVALPPAPFAASAPSSNMSTSDVTEPSAATSNDDETTVQEEEATTIARVVDPNWRDLADYEKARFYRTKPDGGFVSICTGPMRFQQHVQNPKEARLVVRDTLGKVLLCVRIDPGQKFHLSGPTTKPGKKSTGRIDFLGTTDRGMEKLALSMDWTGASDLHPKLQELGK